MVCVAALCVAGAGGCVIAPHVTTMTATPAPAAAVDRPGPQLHALFPRVDTIEQLDALPHGSVILAGTITHQADGDVTDREYRWRASTGQTRSAGEVLGLHVDVRLVATGAELYRLDAW